jgi:hypothetical protein
MNSQAVGSHMATCPGKGGPDLRPFEELTYVAKEFGLTEDQLKFDGIVGRRTGTGRTVTLARGVFFHRMWAWDAKPLHVAAAIGSSVRTVRHWFSAFNRSKAA